MEWAGRYCDSRRAEGRGQRAGLRANVAQAFRPAWRITMNDETKKPEDQNELSRRDFVAMGIAAGIVAAAGGASAADMPVTEKDVEITTPDGTCNAAFIHPTTGSHAAVIIWADAFGLRQVMRE